MVRGAKEPKIDLSGSLKNKFTRGPRQTDKSAPLLFRVLCTENKLEVEKFALKGLQKDEIKFSLKLISINDVHMFLEKMCGKTVSIRVGKA